MYNLGLFIRKAFLIILVIIVMPFNSYSRDMAMSFLPMEDSMSAQRNNLEIKSSNMKPYREPFSLGNQKIESGFSFSNSDILAFVLLAGVYIVLVRRNSKTRNVNF